MWSWDICLPCIVSVVIVMDILIKCIGGVVKLRVNRPTQECIPVGCVPSPPGTPPPREQAPPPEQAPPREQTPL